MNDRTDDAEPVEETDEAKLYVADPDDYAKTRKLKALNDAKSHVRKLRNDRPPRASTKEWEGINARIAEAVATYGHELLPLLEEAEQSGTIDDDDFLIRSEKRDIDVRALIRFDGRLPAEHKNELESPPAAHVMAIFRHLQTLERKLGLGLDLEPEQNSEWEIET